MDLVYCWNLEEKLSPQKLEHVASLSSMGPLGLESNDRPWPWIVQDPNLVNEWIRRFYMDFKKTTHWAQQARSV